MLPQNVLPREPHKEVFGQSSFISSDWRKRSELVCWIEIYPVNHRVLQNKLLVRIGLTFINPMFALTGIRYTKGERH